MELIFIYCCLLNISMTSSKELKIQENRENTLKNVMIK